MGLGACFDCDMAQREVVVLRDFAASELGCGLLNRFNASFRNVVRTMIHSQECGRICCTIGSLRPLDQSQHFAGWFAGFRQRRPKAAACRLVGCCDAASSNQPFVHVAAYCSVHCLSAERGWHKLMPRDRSSSSLGKGSGLSRKLLDEINSGEYGNPLKQFHRDAKLDLVLAWGSLDGALTMLVSAFTGEDFQDAASRLLKVKGTVKILEIARILQEHEQDSQIAKNFKRLKKRYEKHSKPRNRIAHGHCAGYLLGDEQYLVFAVAEPEGVDRMVVEAIPVEEIIAATEYGQTLTDFAAQTAEKFWAARAT